MVRSALHLLLVATVLLAGCSGLGGSDATETTAAPTATAPGPDPTDTPTPSRSPTSTRSPTPTHSPTSNGPSIDPVPASAVPPGANATHVAAADQLLVANMNALRGDDYDVTTAIYARSDGEVLADSRDRYRNDVDRRRHVWLADSRSTTRIQYYDETGVYVNVTKDGETRTYKAVGGGFEQVPTFSIQRQKLSRILRAGVYTANGTTTVDGRPLARYDLTTPGADTGDNSTGYVLVSPDGVVHRAVLRDTFVDDDGGLGYFRYTYRVGAVGDVSIEEPAWLANATD